jgi:hypothetical protein
MPRRQPTAPRNRCGKRILRSGRPAASQYDPRPTASRLITRRSNCCRVPGRRWREPEEVAVGFAWLERHERWTFHHTPTSASWLNAVEGFFAKLTNRRLKRGVFTSIVELQAAINRFVAETNQQPKPFTWTADPDKIIAAVRRGHQTLDLIH